MMETHVRPFRELSLVLLSPFFAALFGLPVLQGLDLVIRPWLYTDLRASFFVLALGLVAGVSFSCLGIRWLLALLFREKASYNLSYHLVYLFLPTAAMVAYMVECALSGFTSPIQSTTALVMFAVSGVGLGLASTTLGAMTFAYRRVSGRKERIVWVYHRGRSRLSGTVELFRVPRAG